MPQHADGTTQDAIGEAKQNHADLAVIGTYQIVGNQIRVNGNLVDVATNTSLGGFSATGQQSDVFKVEDALGEQFRNLLPQPMTTNQMAEATVEPPIPPIVQPTYSSPPTVTYDGSAAAPVYVEPAYPDYYYDSYPFGFYGGLGFYSGSHYGDYRNGGRGYVHHDFGHAYSSRPGLTPNPTFHNPVYHGAGVSGSHFGGAGAHGGGFGGGGGHAGGGGGGHR